MKVGYDAQVETFNVSPKVTLFGEKRGKPGIKNGKNMAISL